MGKKGDNRLSKVFDKEVDRRMRVSNRSRWLHLCLSVVVSGGILYGGARPLGAFPAATQLLNPAQGVHTVAGEETLPTMQTFRVFRTMFIFFSNQTEHLT
jgi:hypothetical protein